MGSGGENMPGPLYYATRNMLVVCERWAPLGLVATWRRRAVVVAASRGSGAAVARGEARRCARFATAGATSGAGGSGDAAPDGRAEQLLRADARGAARARGAAARHARAGRRRRARRPRRLPRARLHGRDDHNLGEPLDVAPYAWERQDAEALGHDDGSFDWGVVSAGLHHCRSPHVALLELYRVARRGLLALEARDSALMRAAIRLGVADEYELTAVADNAFSSGGVRNSAVPNYVYRWTEREVEKTIRSAAPHARDEFVWFHELELPLSVLEVGGGRRGLAKALRALQPAARAVARVAPGQANLFAFAVLKSDELQPWLRPGTTARCRTRPRSAAAWDERRRHAAAARPAPAGRPAPRRARPVLGLRRGDAIRLQLVAAAARRRRRVGRVGAGVRAPRDDDLLRMFRDAAGAPARGRPRRALRAGRGLPRGAGRGARLPRARRRRGELDRLAAPGARAACRSSATPSTVPGRCRARI